MAVKARRPPLGTVVLALLAASVVGAAVADSIGKSVSTEHARSTQAPPPAHVALPNRSALASALRRGGAGGVLYFVDDTCRLHAIHVPALTATAAPRGVACRALVSPATAPPGWSLWPRDTPLAARCERQRVVVSATAGPALPMIGGCAPAWRPDGSITYVRRGAIVQFPRVGRAQVLRSRNQLSAALARFPSLRGTSGWRVTSIAWLASTRFAVLARSKTRSAIALFAGRQIVGLRQRLPAGLSELRASPLGDFLVLRGRGRIVVYSTRSQALPRSAGFAKAVAVAWSSDERWHALARAGGIVLVGPGARLTLRVRARDLAWTREL